MQTPPSLLHRTTRALSLTHEGARYLEGARRVLAAVEALQSDLDGPDGLRGVLRISAPLTYCDTVVAAVASRFVAAHPGVTVEMDLSDSYVDLARGGFDLAIRIGDLTDSSLRIRKLGETRMVPVAAPAYLAAHGAPQHPAELSDHVCIRDANTSDPSRWPFDVEGQRISVPVSGPFLANSPPACLVPTLAGVGIFLCPDVFLGDHIEAGRLVPVLGAFHSRTVPIHSVQLPSAFHKPRVAAFAEMLRDEIRARLRS